MARRNISSGGKWEPVVGYSRAVRVGGFVAVAGTTAAGPDGSFVGDGDVAAQARESFRRIAAALEAAGASLRDVVRTRMFLARIEDADTVGEVHREFFGEIRPAATMLAVSAFVDPRMLIEIEADAIVEADRPA